MNLFFQVEYFCLSVTLEDFLLNVDKVSTRVLGILLFLYCLRALGISWPFF